MYLSDIIPDIDLNSLSDNEVNELFELFESMIAHEIPPKMQILQKKLTRFNVLIGGRGGGKTEGLVRLFKEWIENDGSTALVIREVQDTLEMSSISAVEDIIKKCGDSDEWHRSGRIITHKPTGGQFFFCGMNERNNKDVGQNIKSIHNVRLCWADEAQFFTENSLALLTPSIRGRDDDIFGMFSEDTQNFIYFTMNQKTTIDPVVTKFVNRKRDDTTVIRINYEDNPFFPHELEMERQEDLKEAEALNDFDEYNHKWKGYPRSQEKTALLLYSEYEKAITANLKPEGNIFVGVDVARSGDDSTIFYKRKGRKLIDKREYGSSQYGLRPIDQQADFLEDFVDMDKKTHINIDEGSMGAGLVDLMRRRGYENCYGIYFQQKAKNPDKYPNAISEMAYEFVKDVHDGIVDISIEAKNDKLQVDLCQRLREITNSGKRSIEKKADFKKRYGRSPDHGDALLLCYYNNTLYSEIQEKHIHAMKARRRGKHPRRI